MSIINGHWMRLIKGQNSESFNFVYRYKLEILLWYYPNLANELQHTVGIKQVSRWELRKVEEITTTSRSILSVLMYDSKVTDVN